jgi:hypothetical protein
VLVWSLGTAPARTEKQTRTETANAAIRPPEVAWFPGLAPRVPPGARSGGRSGSVGDSFDSDRTMTTNRELGAVVAHGLLNTLAVLHDAAASLLAFGHRISGDERETLVAAIEVHGETWADGLDLILEECSPAFADAASAVALLSRVVRAAHAEDLTLILDGFVSKTVTLRTGLEAQVRALPAEVLALLQR